MCKFLPSIRQFTNDSFSGWLVSGGALLASVKPMVPSVCGVCQEAKLLTAGLFRLTLIRLAESENLERTCMPHGDRPALFSLPRGLMPREELPPTSSCSNRRTMGLPSQRR